MIDAALPTMIDEVLPRFAQLRGMAVAHRLLRRHLIGTRHSGAWRRKTASLGITIDM
jgi:hypothetical protein